MQVTLEGKTALITGAGRNLGRAMALAFAEAGAKLVLNARASRDELEAVAEEVRALGSEALPLLADVGDAQAVARMVAQALAWAVGVDILVNNAAKRPRQSFLETSVEDWDRVIRTNLSGAFYCSRSVVPSMVERGYGRIINISGIDGQMGASNRVHNVSCKAGLMGMTKAMASELGRFGVTVNSIVPGAFDTTRDLKDYPGWPPSEASMRRYAVPRLGRPEELGPLSVYLASEASGYVTGQSIHINGGLFMW